MLVPTFILAGAWKCGSTALADVLAQHPDIVMSSRKEPEYFIRHYAEGLGFYSHLYHHYRGEIAIGEASVGYLQDPDVPSRMHEELPEVRLIFILRNPVDRAISHYFWHQGIGRGKRPISELVEGSSDSCPEIRSSLYGTNLSRFLEYFDIGQLHIVVAEEFRKSPVTTVGSIFRHIGVDDSVKIKRTGNTNAAIEPRSESVARMLSLAHRSLRDLGAGSSRRPMVTLAARAVNRVSRINRRPLSTYRRDEASIIRAALYERLLPEIELTEDLFNLSLDAWRVIPTARKLP